MRRQFLIIVSLLIYSFRPVYSQSDTSITFHFAEREVLLESVLEKVRNESSFNFSYNPSKVKTDTMIELPAASVSVEELLDLLVKYGIESEISGQHIILKKAKKLIVPVGPSFYTISGYISDSRGRESLVGASVAEIESGKGTITNSYGYFSLRMIEGHHELIISFVGYKPERLSVELEKDIVIEQILEEQLTSIEEVTVISDELKRPGTPMTGTNIQMPAVTIGRMPGFLGETDVIKSLQSIPGISFYSDGSTIFHVRGGARDQNLLMIDEAPVYNPAHLLGIFSVFSPDALNSVNIYKGDMPARYGGRLSSVIDIKMKEGNRNRFVFSGNTSPVATCLNIESPLNRKKGSFYLSARKSHLKWLIEPGSPSVEKLYFSDFNLKTNIRLNEKNRLFFSLFSGVDQYRNREARFRSSGISWQNFAGNIRWNRVIANDIFMNTSLIISYYDYGLYQSYELNNRWKSSIALAALKSDFSWYANPGTTLRWGFSFSDHRYFPGHFLSGNNTVPLASGVEEKNAGEDAIYISYSKSFGERSGFYYGMRLVGWKNKGPGTEFEYDELDNVSDTLEYPAGIYNRFLSLEPRASYYFSISDQWQSRLSLTRNTQFEHLISNSISPFTSLEVWLPAGPNIRPMYSDLASVGFTWKSRSYPIYFDSEFFAKKTTNFVSYVDHAYMLFNPQVDREILYGKAMTVGAEFILKKTGGKWDGWISYVYTRSMAKIAGINDGKEFPSRYDRPVTFSTAVFWQAKPRMKLSLNFIYMTGIPFTTPTAYYYYNGYQVPYYDERNNDRLPDYHRLDAGCDIRLNKPAAKSEHSLRFSIFNLYGKKNPFSINFNKTLDDNGNIIVPTDLNQLPELETTMMYLYGVIPSIAYHFRF